MYFCMLNLKISKLSIHYNQPLLDRVDLYVSGHKVIALIGDNGSGKSTLLKIIAGTEQPLSGEINWSFVPSIGYMKQELSEQSTLSGGQQKIVMLADLIYSSSHDVLLLDEPDNHLDLEGKQWLEEAIRSFNGLVIVISHDREFLENISDVVWLVEDHVVQSYPFGFKKFQEKYADNLVALEKKYQLQLREKKRLEEMVRAFLVRLQQGKGTPSLYRHALKRLEQHTQNMIPDPKKNSASITIAAKRQGRVIKGKTAVLVKDLSFKFPEQTVFADANFELGVTDKAALVSPNGSGKSTLIKLLLGQIDPDEGIARIGPSLKIGYYSQDHAESLDGEMTPIQIFALRFSLWEGEAEGVLKRFLFSKQTAKSKISTLSGGQKARLQLALFLYTNPDILILDEPTNHLDLKSIAALENFLSEYNGALLLISHDRQMVRNLDIPVFGIENGKIRPASLENDLLASKS